MDTIDYNAKYYRIDPDAYPVMALLLDDLLQLLNRYQPPVDSSQDDLSRFPNTDQTLIKRSRKAIITHVKNVATNARKFNTMIDIYLSNNIDQRINQLPQLHPQKSQKHLDSILPVGEPGETILGKLPKDPKASLLESKYNIKDTLDALTDRMMKTKRYADKKLVSPISGYFAGSADIPAVIYEGFRDNLTISIDAFLSYLEYHQDFRSEIKIDKDGNILKQDGK